MVARCCQLENVKDPFPCLYMHWVYGASHICIDQLCGQCHVFTSRDFFPSTQFRLGWPRSPTRLRNKSAHQADRQVYCKLIKYWKHKYLLLGKIIFHVVSKYSVTIFYGSVIIAESLISYIKGIGRPLVDTHIGEGSVSPLHIPDHCMEVCGQFSTSLQYPENSEN